MSYTPHPGSGSLFRNNRKERDNQPDYKGQLRLPDGTTMQLGGWLSEGANGKYLALKVSAVLPPRAEPEE